MGDATLGSPIPLHAGIKAHTICEENAHMRHMQRVLQFCCRVGLAWIPPPKAVRLFSCLRPDALSPLPTTLPVWALCGGVHQRIIPDDMGIPRYRSWTYRGGAKRSFSTYVDEGIDATVLYFGGFDPSGEDMHRSLLSTDLPNIDLT